MKRTPIIIALGLFAFLIVIWSRPDEPVATSFSVTKRGPSFEVLVVKPLSARPLFGLLPGGIFGLPPDELRLDHLSPGAEVGSVEHNRLELRADGWDLLIKTDDDGKIASGTHLLFPIKLAERQLSLRCRPADRSTGSFRTTTPAGSGELDGSFLVELAACENVETGKDIPWPPAPLTVRGSFEGLPRGPR